MATIGTELAMYVYMHLHGTTMQITGSYNYLCRANQSRARDFTTSDQVYTVQDGYIIL